MMRATKAAITLAGAGFSYIIYRRKIGQQSKPITAYATREREAFRAHGAIRFPTLYAEASTVEKRNAPMTDRRFTLHQSRFQQFASVTCNDKIYMTFSDFLRSVSSDDDDSDEVAEKHMRHIDSSEVEEMLTKVPPIAKGHPHMFRLIGSDGLISFTEYLFLLCVLTRPHASFRIAFNMFDVDGNGRVDRDEFLVVERILGLKSIDHNHQPESAMEKRNIWEMKTQKNRGGNLDNTSLLVHLFGLEGDLTLSYDDFHRFMDNLQTEVLDLEFSMYATENRTISAENFARNLLRYSIPHKKDRDKFIESAKSRLERHKEEITFEDFKLFCLFLNSLEDFSIAMRLYTFGNHAISKREFQRAVMISTGFRLSSGLVDCVYSVFDADGDGRLQHSEFLKVMKNRLHRAFPSCGDEKGYGADQWRSCVNNFMREH